MKTFKLQITEDELIALIFYHTNELSNQATSGNGKPSNETAQRLVDLTRRLNKETPDIESDPRPKDNGQIAAGEINAKMPEGW